MIRKQTWIVLCIFIVLLAAAIILQNNPGILSQAKEATPSQTSQTMMVDGWQSDDISWIELQDSQENTLRVIQDATGKWVLDAENGEAVNAGVVEEVRSQIAAADILAYLDPGYDLEAVGLITPEHTLTIRNQQGRQSVICIGKMTPTETGYYVQVDNAAPAVVSKFAIEAILDKLQREQLVTLETFPGSQP